MAVAFRKLPDVFSPRLVAADYNPISLSRMLWQGTRWWWREADLEWQRAITAMLQDRKPHYPDWIKIGYAAMLTATLTGAVSALQVRRWCREHPKARPQRLEIRKQAGFVTEEFIRGIDWTMLAGETWEDFKARVFTPLFDTVFEVPHEAIAHYLDTRIPPIRNATEELRKRVRDTVAQAHREGWDDRRFEEELMAQGRWPQGRVRNQIETETATMFNASRLHSFQQDDMVVGYEYVATVDDRTTELCRSLNGKKVTKEDLGEVPPLHFYCRTILEPLFEWDKVPKWDDARLLSRPGAGEFVQFRGFGQHELLTTLKAPPTLVPAEIRPPRTLEELVGNVGQTLQAEHGGVWTWNGKIMPTTDPSIAGAKDWDCTILLDAKTQRWAERLLGPDAANTWKAASRMAKAQMAQAQRAILHESIHGLGADALMPAMYQRGTAWIEEGITDLAARLETPKALGRLGIKYTGMSGSYEEYCRTLLQIVDPKWATRKGVEAALRDPEVAVEVRRLAFHVPRGERANALAHNLGARIGATPDRVRQIQWRLMAGFDTTGDMLRHMPAVLAPVRKGFHFATAIERKAMRIPPAWTDVQVANNKRAALQAIGADSKGRAQYLYSAEHSERQAAAKFARLKGFDAEAQKVAARARRDMLAGRDTEEAGVLNLIGGTGFRIGSRAETRAAVRAFGASTLEAEHVTIRGSEIVFRFIGKKGVLVEKMIVDRELAEFLAPRVKAGGALFNTTEAKVRAYMHRIDRDFLIKDFRTWRGTRTALKLIETLPVPKTKAEYNRLRMQVGRAVAAELGNTPVVTLKSYVDPSVFSPWQGVLM